MTPRLSLSLLDYLKMVPDFRSAQGKRHPLYAILAQACAAVLCGCRSLSAIAQWGRDYGSRVARALGYTRPYTPCTTTFHLIFKGLDKEEFEATLGGWAQSLLGQAELENALVAVAVDGKTLRGTLAHADIPGVHLLAAVSHHLGLTMGPVPVEEGTNEITTVLSLLRAIDLSGWVVTTDALLTQREVAEAILAQEGDYLMVVKQNQPTLYEDIATLFAEPMDLIHLSTAQTTSLHGDRIETRRLWASSDLVGYSDWPGLQQVLKQERTVINKRTREVHRKTRYAVTSLSAERADASPLLTCWRGHWQIENGTHWVRDVTFDEDRSQVRSGNAPQVMAAIRNVTTGLMRWAGHTNIAAACRRHAARPHEALALLGIPLGEN